MPQPVQSDILSPTVEQQPADCNDAPPREVPEYDLQVDEQLADLHIQVADIKAQHAVDVIRKDARDDGYAANADVTFQAKTALPR